MSYTCSSCGCDVAENALHFGQAIKHGNRIYCVECADLIIGPGQGGEQQVSHANEGIEVLEEYSITAGEPTAPAKKSKSSVGKRTGFEVVEEVSIPIDREPARPVHKPAVNSVSKRQAAGDDDDWFASNKPAAAEPAPVERPARVSASKIAPASRSGGGSGRFPGAKQSGRKRPSSRVLPRAKTPPPQDAVEAPIEEPAPVVVAEEVDPQNTDTITDGSAKEVVGNKGSKRMRPGRPSGRISGVGAAVKKNSGRGPAVDAPSPSRSSARGSRRMEAAKSSRKGREEDRDEKRDKRRGSSQQGMSTGMMVGIGIGVVVLLLGVFALTGNRSEESDPKKKKETLVDDGDKTPSGTYAKMAEERLAAGDKVKAGYFYSRAGDQAQKEGNQSAAQRYEMKAYDIKKFTTLNHGH